MWEQPECQDLIYFSVVFIFFRGLWPNLLCVLLNTKSIVAAYLMLNKRCFDNQLEYLCFGFQHLVVVAESAIRDTWKP